MVCFVVEVQSLQPPRSLVSASSVAGWAALRTDQRGITGLETAIVLIAFVVVASVFACVRQETTSTLTLRGVVLADSNTGKTAIDTIKFTISAASETAKAVDLSSVGTVVTYLDDDQALNCTSSGTPSCSWTTTWVIGSGDLVDPGEQVDVTVNISKLTPPLGPNKEFTIRLKPNKGAVVIVTRTTPAELKGIMNLQ